MRFSFVAAERAEYSVAALCDVLDVSRCGFYAWQARPESKRTRDDRRLAVMVRASHEESRRTYGSPRSMPTFERRTSESAGSVSRV